MPARIAVSRQSTGTPVRAPSATPAEKTPVAPGEPTPTSQPALPLVKRAGAKGLYQVTVGDTVYFLRSMGRPLDAQEGEPRGPIITGRVIDVKSDADPKYLLVEIATSRGTDPLGQPGHLRMRIDKKSAGNLGIIPLSGTGQFSKPMLWMELPPKGDPRMVAELRATAARTPPKARQLLETSESPGKSAIPFVQDVDGKSYAILGRASKKQLPNKFVVDQDQGVSREHAQIVKDRHGRLFIKDLTQLEKNPIVGVLYGTWIKQGNQWIQVTQTFTPELKPGTEIALGTMSDRSGQVSRELDGKPKLVSERSADLSETTRYVVGSDGKSLHYLPNAPIQNPEIEGHLLGLAEKVPLKDVDAQNLSRFYSDNLTKAVDSNQGGSGWSGTALVFAIVDPQTGKIERFATRENPEATRGPEQEWVIRYNEERGKYYWAERRARGFPEWINEIPENRTIVPLRINVADGQVAVNSEGIRQLGLSSEAIQRMENLDGFRSLSGLRESKIPEAPGLVELITTRPDGTMKFHMPKDAEEVFLGRRELNNPSVSPQHAVFFHHKGQLAVRDLGSLNGTIVKRILPDGSQQTIYNSKSPDAPRGGMILQTGDIVFMGTAHVIVS